MVSFKWSKAVLAAKSVLLPAEKLYFVDKFKLKIIILNTTTATNKNNKATIL